MRAIARRASASVLRCHSRAASVSASALRPDEVPTILQRGERVLSRAEVARGAGGSIPVAVHLNVDARGAQMGVAEQLATVLRNAQPEFERIAVAAVGNAMRRGRLT